jgi:hypothetical protein
VSRFHHLVGLVQCTFVFAGWSRSAIKGPSAWDAKSYARSDGETEPGSPSMTDGEELGDEDVDYDDVSIYPSLTRFFSPSHSGPGDH